MTIIRGLPANMSRNFSNILEGFQKVVESLDGPERQYVEDCWQKCRGNQFAKMSRNTNQCVDNFFDVMAHHWWLIKILHYGRHSRNDRYLETLPKQPLFIELKKAILVWKAFRTNFRIVIFLLRPSNFCSNRPLSHQWILTVRFTPENSINKKLFSSCRKHTGSRFKWTYYIKSVQLEFRLKSDTFNMSTNFSSAIPRYITKFNDLPISRGILARTDIPRHIGSPIWIHRHIGLIYLGI